VPVGLGAGVDVGLYQTDVRFSFVKDFNFRSVSASIVSVCQIK
jgi:hypothetical protein